MDLPGLGPTPPFGLLVVTGVMLGWVIAVRQAKRRGVDEELARTVFWWTVVGGFIMAKLFDVVAYGGELSIRTGISSVGGFLGATMGFFLYFQLHEKDRPVRMLLADCVALGLVVGWIFGRAGCFVVHDHKGLPTDFFLGIDFPEGRRHDLGFYEMLITMVFAAIMHLLNRKDRPVGFFIGLLPLLYGPVRVGLDFLRLEETDQRYLGLTPAQHVSVGMAIVGAVVLYRALTGKTEVPRAAAVEQAAETPAKGKRQGGKPQQRKGGKR